MKIAIGTDDKKTIRNGHFGQSLHYRIIEMVNGEIVSQECRQNPYAAYKQGRHPHAQAEEINELLSDCSLFMAKSMGKKSMRKLTADHIDCIITEIDPIDQAIAEYLYGKEEAFKYYDADKAALIPCSQRMIKGAAHHQKLANNVTKEKIQ